MEIQRIDKPWGYELVWARVPGAYVGKVLHIKAGEALSLQYHERKDETIFVFAGQIELELENEQGELTKKVLSSGEGSRIPPGRRHRMTAMTDSDLLEASTDDLDDVVRLEDRYGRVPEG